MNEQRMATDRNEMARRVADFRETQARFQRAREAYYEATIEKLRTAEGNDSVSTTLPN